MSPVKLSFFLLNLAMGYSNCTVLGSSYTKYCRKSATNILYMYIEWVVYTCDNHLLYGALVHCMVQHLSKWTRWPYNSLFHGLE